MLFEKIIDIIFICVMFVSVCYSFFTTSSINTSLMIIVECIVLHISTTLILASNKAQMEIEVKNQIRQEENKKILNIQ